MFRRLTKWQLGQRRRHVDIGRCCFEPAQSTDMHHNRNYCIITPPIHCIGVSSQHFSNSTKYHRLAALKEEQNRNLSFTSPDSTLLELTGQFSVGQHRISYPARPRPKSGQIFTSGPGRIWPPDMRSDLTIFRCICLTVYLGRNSLFYKFRNLHLSISSWACGSYPHPHFRLYFIAGYIVTLCDVAQASSSRIFCSSPGLGPGRICNPKSGQIRPRLDLKKSNPVQPY